MATTLECSVEEGGEDLLGETRAHDTRAEAEDIGIVVGPCHSGRIEVVAQRCAHTMHLVRGQLLTLATAAEHDAEVGLTVADRTTHCRADGWIVAALGGVGPQIDDLMPLATQHISEMRLELVARMIGADGDP